MTVVLPFAAESMEIFNYLAVAVSIILGLGLTYLLNDVSKVIQYSKTITHYWVQVVWVVILFLLHVQFWWGFWFYHTVDSWTYPQYVVVLAGPSFLYLLADLAFPELTPHQPIDLRAHYYQVRRWFFPICSVYVGCAMFAANFIRPTPSPHPDLANGLRLALIVLGVVGAVSDSHKVHRVLAIIAALLVVTFIGAANMERLS